MFHIFWNLQRPQFPSAGHCEFILEQNITCSAQRSGASPLNFHNLHQIPGHVDTLDLIENSCASGSPKAAIGNVQL